MRHYERWKVLGSTLLGAAVSLWLAVTWADDKIRKVERIPAIEEAVLQMKLAQEVNDRRMQRLEERQAKVEHKLDTTQGEILEKLDVLVERQR